MRYYIICYVLYLSNFFFHVSIILGIIPYVLQDITKSHIHIDRT